MEENLANRSRSELEAALLDSGRALQAMLAAQLRGFDGAWAWTPTRGSRAPGAGGGAGASWLGPGGSVAEGHPRAGEP